MPTRADYDARKKRVYEMREQGKVIKEIAAKEGISDSRVRQILEGDAYLEKLRKHHKKRRSIKPKPVVIRGPRTPKRETENAPEANQEIEQQIAYIFGRIEAQLEVYATNHRIPLPVLSSRLSELLRDKEGRTLLRSAHRVSRVR